MQEYFQSKIGRKIRIFSLGRKNNILILKKREFHGVLISYNKVNNMDKTMQKLQHIGSIKDLRPKNIKRSTEDNIP